MSNLTIDEQNQGIFFLESRYFLLIFKKGIPPPASCTPDHYNQKEEFQLILGRSGKLGIKEILSTIFSYFSFKHRVTQCTKNEVYY